jgi:hypothetical protein
MKRIFTIFIALLFYSITCNSDTPPVRDLIVNELGNASWNTPDIIVDLPLWLRYDNGNNIQSIGLLGGGTIEAAIKWDTMQLIGFDNTFITKIKFFAGNYPNVNFTVRVYQGSSGDVVYEQPLSNVSYGNWNTIILDSPVEIDVHQSIWVGYFAVHIAGEYPAGSCSLVENLNSDIVRYNGGEWMQLRDDVPNSWSLAAFVEGPDGQSVQLPVVSSNETRPNADKISNVFVTTKTKGNLFDSDYQANELVSYHVYIDGAYLGSTKTQDWQYQDLLNGETYMASVSAIYTDGESELSNYEFSYLPPPKDFFITQEGRGTWNIPSNRESTIYLEEDFNDGLSDDWQIIHEGNTEYTWTICENYQESTFDGTPFLMANSDDAGANSILDETLLSPVVNVSDANQLVLKWDQNFRSSTNNGDYLSVSVFNGAQWIEVFNQTDSDSAWPDYSKNSLDLTQYVNPEFQFKFHYYADGWCWWAFLDDIVLFSGESISYNLYLDGTMVGTTNNVSWQYIDLTEGQTYTGGVTAVYDLGESDVSEYEFLFHEESDSLEVNPSDKEVSYLGGVVYYAVTSNETWYVSSSDSWIDIATPIGSGDGYIEVEYDENTEDARVGTIVIQSNSEQIVYVTISQDGIDDFLPPRNLHITEYGLAIWDSPDGDLTDLVGYNVYLDGELYTSTLDQNRQFLTLTPNQTYTAGVQAVYSSPNLSSIIEMEFIYTSNTDVFVTPQIQTAEAEAGNVIYTVFSNTNWTIDSEDSWVTISPSTGTNDGEIRVFFLENTASERTAQIVISADGLDDVVASLIQQGTNSLDTQVSILPDIQDVSSSVPFSDSIEISEVENLARYKFEILFNPNFLNVVSSDIGSFITSTGREIDILLNNISNDFGFIEVEVSTIGGDIPGVDGDGTLLNIDWDIVGQVNAQTTTGLLLRNITCFDTDGSQIDFTSNDASIIIAPNSINSLNFADRISIIPNPNEGKFQLKILGVGMDMKLLIFNSNGKLISDYKIDNNANHEFIQNVDLSQMRKGIYILKFINDIEVITRRVIII